MSRSRCAVRPLGYDIQGNDHAFESRASRGLVFLVFLSLHLVNTALAALGPAVYDGVQGVLRIFYQAPVVELVLATALLLHIAVGVTRLVTERQRALTPRSRWHRYAAIFLLVVIFGHIAAVRGPSLLLDIHPGFYGLAFSLDYVPVYFYPYYFLFGLAGAYHGVNGALIALGRLGLRAPSVSLGLMSVCVAVLLVFALLGLGGVLFTIDDPSTSDFAKLASEIVAGLSGG